MSATSASEKTNDAPRIEGTVSWQARQWNNRNYSIGHCVVLQWTCKGNRERNVLQLHRCLTTKWICWLYLKFLIF